MSFFQNVFAEDFEGIWVLGDRQHSPTFVCKANAGRDKEIVIAWNKGPYDLSGNDADGNSKALLKLAFRLFDTKNWATISVDITTGAASSSAVTPEEIVAALNSDTTFSERFVASISSYNLINNADRKIMIRQRKPVTELKFYIINGFAEGVLRFNARAGVYELPTYFAKHTIANRFTYTDGQGYLIQLTPGTNIDAAIINNAVDARGVSLGYSHSTVQSDWQLLKGRCGLFQFTKGPSANAVSTTETTIVYPAGAIAGDLATKIVVQKDASTVVVARYEMPYTLTSGDLITPP